jgi:hypothetical protein
MKGTLSGYSTGSDALKRLLGCCRNDSVALTASRSMLLAAPSAF